ncbi:MAG: 23S rRNA (adenine(2503)-C(2))-methyltransferase RlmN [Patescibacteria group bacterium]|nr:23S rRNA (adenine(2503)-C(2))-methyltransferase RlmN [Patescibacteria group bacterium]MDD5490615.1 23S rRNA (adenine(2503)-C(2))-methyltransferase RlmN [Patescibacteria group bacterium]
MNLDCLAKVFREEPPYRQKQAKRAVFLDLIDDWGKATVLSKPLRISLQAQCPLDIKGEIIWAKDQNSAKALIALDDGLKVESVLMKHKDGRNTVCVSSAVGCPLGCLFCATGQMGFKRNLNSWEIVGQVLFFARQLKSSLSKITNVVFMGMGEPFLNYDNVLAAVRILNDKDGLNIGARRISLSTVGVIEGIKKLSKENLQVNLAISLHAPNDFLRSKIIPANKKYPLKEILREVDAYIKKTNRRVMFEYILLAGVNDSPKEARELAALIKKPLHLVNLIPCNKTGMFKPPTKERIRKFREILEKSGVAVTERWRFGREIDAACGQLAIKKLNNKLK